MKRINFLFAFFCSYTSVYAQLSTNERPISFDSEQSFIEISKSATPIVTTPEIDVTSIDADDKENEKYKIPPRFGYKHKVNYDLNNSGIWYEFPNGDKLWQLNVVCPGAFSVNICYDKFWIPEGGKFFVYSKDKQQSIGAFTSKNNKGNRYHVRGFATGLIYGGNVVLEYFQPKNVTNNAIISLDYIVHGYRNVKAGNGSLPCMININCDEGQDWQNEKKAVARIILEGVYYNSGSLITTTNLDQEPFLLTANHSLKSLNKDAARDPNLDYTIFYWNYEAPGCDNINGEPTNTFSTNGATIIANDDITDFALLKLIEDPKDEVGYIPYYLGWDRSGQGGDSCVCIHHPGGDVKKISKSNGQPIDNYINWSVSWKETPNGYGIVEGGSSGSPLLNNMHRVIGQLQGSNIEECNNPNMLSYYGAFKKSWTGNGNDSLQRRLDCWIDSLHTGAQTMEGLLVIPTTRTLNTNQQLYSNILITSYGQLTIQGNIELVGNCEVIVESGGKLVIDGGTLSNADILLESGSSLQIINGGVIDTSYGIKAQLGSTVDIIYGQIL